MNQKDAFLRKNSAQRENTGAGSHYPRIMTWRGQERVAVTQEVLPEHKNQHTGVDFLFLTKGG